MPLSAKALGQALHEDLTLHSTLCRREAGAFQKAIQSGDEVLVACTQEKRLFSELAEQTESAVSVIRFVNIRETGGWSRDAAKATPKISAPAGGRAPERPRASAHGQLQERRARADHRCPRCRRARGRAAVRRAGHHDLRHGSGQRRRRAGAAVSGAGRAHHRPERLAGRVRPALGGEQPDQPGPVHPLQRLRGRLPGRRHRPGLPDRSGGMQVPPRLRQGLPGGWRHRFHALTRAAVRAFRPGAGPARRQRHAHLQPARVAAGLFPLGRPGPANGAQAARAGRRVREAEVLRLQAEALRPQPQRKNRLQRLRGHLLGRSDLQ
jgi:hypothetical protein